MLHGGFIHASSHSAMSAWGWKPIKSNWNTFKFCKLICETVTSWLLKKTAVYAVYLLLFSLAQVIDTCYANLVAKINASGRCSIRNTHRCHKKTSENLAAPMMQMLLNPHPEMEPGQMLQCSHFRTFNPQSSVCASDTVARDVLRTVWLLINEHRHMYTMWTRPIIDVTIPLKRSLLCIIDKAGKVRGSCLSDSKKKGNNPGFRRNRSPSITSKT